MCRKYFCALLDKEVRGPRRCVIIKAFSVQLLLLEAAKPKQAGDLSIALALQGTEKEDERA